MFQVGAYCYAELGCMISKTGADYAYIMETFGPFLAFVRLWVECMIVRPCSQAIVALTFSVYALKPFFEECDPPENTTKILAAVCISKLNNDSVLVGIWEWEKLTKFRNFHFSEFQFLLFSSTFRFKAIIKAK